MWKTALENSALILGIAISIYTVYLAVDRFLLRRRQHKAIIRSLQIKAKYMIFWQNYLLKEHNKLLINTRYILSQDHSVADCQRGIGMILRNAYPNVSCLGI